jgi:chromosomal replication initiation ATPase DnaA
MDYVIAYIKSQQRVKHLEKLLETEKRKFQEEIERLKYMIINPIKKTKQIELHDILKTVCNVTECMPHDILEHSRKRERVLARQLFCYVVMTHYKYSWVAVGRFLNRDHSTVIHSVKTYTDYLSLKYKYETIMYEQVKEALSIDIYEG